MSILKPNTVQIKDFQEITVAIDTLDDIFSDFDPRPLAQRALSEDFLKEIKKFCRETPIGRLTVVFLGPVSLKDELTKNFQEKAIINHFHQEFKKRASENNKIIQNLRGTGFLYILFGMSLLLVLTFLGYKKIISVLSLEVLGVLLMPLGWFGVWEGFSKIVDTPYRLKEEAVMYAKLSKAQYTFKFLGEPTPEIQLPPIKHLPQK